MVWIISWLILGAVAGWIASLITGTQAQMGAATNIVVGIIGAVIGGLALQIFGVSTASGFNFPTLLTAVLGAVILLSLARTFRRNTV